MNRHIAIALFVVGAGAASAYAGDITVDPEPFVSTATRAQVLDELRDFRQSGVNPWADDYQLVAPRSAITRAEVTAEFLASRDEVAALTGEDSGSGRMARTSSRRPHPATAQVARGE